MRWTRLLVCLGLFCTAAQAGIGLPERLVLLGERIAAAPADQGLYLRRALVYSDTGEFKLALADVDTAAQFGEVANTYFVRAIILYRLGQFAQALPLLNQFIKANPGHAEATMYRARVQRDAGQHEAALADYRRYFSLQARAEPGDYLTAARLMVELAGQGRKGYSRHAALAFLDARIQQLGNAPQLQRYAIEIEQQGCRSSEAVARLEQLHANARRAPQWHLHMAEQQLLLARTEAASASLADAKRLLDARRPSADRAQLLHRHDFLAALLTLPTTAKGRSQRTAQLYQRFYPVAAPGSPARSKMRWSDFEQADATHTDGPEDPAPDPHTALAGFEQPQSAASRYDAAWAAPIEPFYRCLRNRQSGSP
ncbi:MAG: tetratricopeptide repeat protein [Pseudomonadota bacterium]